MAFLDARVGSVLRTGVQITGRQFEFLGYSMSSLRTKAVWFVAGFTKADGTPVNAASIRADLGDFSRVLRSPARFGARIAQAFTATDPSVLLRPEQIVREPDIERNGYCFTDGAARMSQALADEVWATMRHVRAAPRVPGAFQFRLGGYKGVVAVDPSLQGSVMYVLCSLPIM